MRRVFAAARRVVAEWEGRMVLVYMASRPDHVHFNPQGYRVANDTPLARAAAR